jgi:hypothetical protein
LKPQSTNPSRKPKPVYNPHAVKSFLLLILTLGNLSLAQPAPPPAPTTTTSGPNFLVFPGAAFQGRPIAKVLPPPLCTLLHLTTPADDRITALFGPALDATGSLEPDAQRRATLLYFYGNGSFVASSLFEFNRFRRTGVNVLVPDYLGYGMSAGKPSETNLYATADACYDYIARHPAGAPHPAKIYAAGWSLGAAVAVDLAGRRDVAGLILFNPFTSMTDMAHRMFPWLPPDAQATYRFDNLAKIKSIRVPAFICNGVQDQFVPPAMSDRLAAAAGGKVTRVRVAAADHNSVFTADPSAVFGPLRRFIATTTP